MLRTVSNKAVSLTYELTYKPVKNINLRVRRDGTVAVSAPKRTAAERIDSFVLSNADRIIEAQKRMVQVKEAEESLTPQIKDGAVVPLLGEKITIRVQESENIRVYLNESTRELYLCLTPQTKSAAKRAYEIWLNDFTQEIFRSVLEKVHPRFAEYKVPFPTLRIREMKTRWGSCIPAKEVITLNARLIHYPLSSIEYVTVHELCHFPEANHSARFYRWMDRMLPCWREEKANLEAISGVRQAEE